LALPVLATCHAPLLLPLLQETAAPCHRALAAALLSLGGTKKPTRVGFDRETSALLLGGKHPAVLQETHARSFAQWLKGPWALGRLAPAQGLRCAELSCAAVLGCFLQLQLLQDACLQGLLRVLG
jgi:hypothetical protein